ncbi:MAG: hypothetical protein SH807_03505 [Blastochloris sp.]|jgi:glyoxylase-like metal-dependent hydrolase (beta-lactamase superfamily II)|nr:hypothetical protein [Blastochloris sp.]
MYKKIHPHLIEWSVYCKDCKTDLFSHAYISEGKVLLIDPILPDDDTLKSIQTLGKPCAILITNGNHERYARIIGDLLKIPIACPALATKELRFKPDVIVDDLKQLHGLVPISLTGAALGEHAYYCTAEKILFIGDALINDKDKGLSILPEKYCLNQKQLEISLKKLLNLDIELIAFAHGKTMPKAGAALKKLLSS